MKRRKKESLKKVVGPFIAIQDVFYDEEQNRYIYLAKMYSKTYTDMPIFQPEEIKKRYYVSIPEPKKLEKFLSYYILEKMKNPGIFISRCGWHTIRGRDYFITSMLFQ